MLCKPLVVGPPVNLTHSRVCSVLAIHPACYAFSTFTDILLPSAGRRLLELAELPAMCTTFRSRFQGCDLAAMLPVGSRRRGVGAFSSRATLATIVLLQAAPTILRMSLLQWQSPLRKIIAATHTIHPILSSIVTPQCHPRDILTLRVSWPCRQFAAVSTVMFGRDSRLRKRWKLRY